MRIENNKAIKPGAHGDGIQDEHHVSQAHNIMSAKAESTS